MPTLLRIGRLRVVVYPNDHRPPHVHVLGDGCEAVFDLLCAEGGVQLRENYRFARAALNGIARTLRSNLDTLCHGWEEVHGVA